MRTPNDNHLWRRILLWRLPKNLSFWWGTEKLKELSRESQIMLMWDYSMYTDKWKYGPQLMWCNDTVIWEVFPNSHCFLLLAFLLPICHCWVRASEAVGIRVLSGISMGNNQMDQASDSRDLFLPAVYQIYLTPLCPLLSIFQFFNSLWSKLCPFVCALSCLIEDWWGWILNVVHRLPRRREKCCRSLFWEPRHQCGFDNITFQKVQK